MGVRIVQVDLSQPLPALLAPRGRGELWIFVKLGLQPLGWVKCRPGDFGRSITPDLLGQLISDQLCREIHDAARKRQFELPIAAQLPSISIVICTRENPAALEKLLASLTWVAYPRFEVIVVDNAPVTDAAHRTCARFNNVHHVVEPRGGIAYARNTGWQVARNDIVAYIDDDATVDPYWLTAMAANFTDERVNCATGLNLPCALDADAAKTFDLAFCANGGFHRRLFTSGSWNSDLWLNLARLATSTNFSIRRSALVAMNGFDPALDRGGVLDLFTRVLRDGGSLVHDPRIIAFDQGRQTLSRLQQQAIDSGFSLTVCCSKFFNDIELGNLSATTLRRWASKQGVRRFNANLGAAVRFRPHVPLHLILLELAGGILAKGAYRRSVRRVKNVFLRFRQKGIVREAA